MYFKIYTSPTEYCYILLSGLYCENYIDDFGK